MSRYRSRRGRLSGFGGFNSLRDQNSRINTIKRISALTGGLAAATIIQKWFNKSDAYSGETVMGLDGNGAASKYLFPLGLGIAGFIGHELSDNRFIKDACLGVAAAAGAQMINKIADKTIVALSGSDEDTSGQMIPGMGATDASYPQLPVDTAAAPPQYDVEPSYQQSVGEIATEPTSEEATYEEGEAVQGFGDIVYEEGETVEGLGEIGFIP